MVGVSDLVFSTLSGATLYVGDSKYKVAAEGVARSSDYYQLLAYCTALDLEEGVLIYCDHDGTKPTREVVVKNAGTRLQTFCLDIGGNTDALRAEIARLADLVVRGAHGAESRSGLVA